MSFENPLRPNGGRLTRDRTNGKFLGVCAGVANYFGIDPLVVRLIFVAGTLLGFGSLALVYVIIAVLAD
jgi:phage shock protein C